jgi:hypothetical protein
MLVIRGHHDSRVYLGGGELVAVLGVHVVNGELPLQLLLPPLGSLASLCIDNDNWKTIFNWN